MLWIHHPNATDTNYAKKYKYNVSQKYIVYAKQNTKYAKKTPSTPTKTTNMPNKTQSMPTKIQSTPNKTPSAQFQSKEYAKKNKYWFTLFCRDAIFLKFMHFFGVPFTGLKKYGGVPKMTNMMYGCMILFDLTWILTIENLIFDKLRITLKYCFSLFYEIYWKYLSNHDQYLHLQSGWIFVFVVVLSKLNMQMSWSECRIWLRTENHWVKLLLGKRHQIKSRLLWSRVIFDDFDKGSHPLPKRMFFYTLCTRPLPPPPPLGFTQSCCGLFDMTVKKCVNVCRDKIPHNSAKFCGKMSNLP